MAAGTVATNDAALRIAIVTVAALALLELAWEWRLAPLKAGGSWLALKALPLALLWPALARGARRARQWLALLLPFYVAEALVRALTESGRHALVALAATCLAAMAFASVLATFRGRAPP